MISCKLHDKNVLIFYSILIKKSFGDQAFLNPLYICEFEKALLDIINTYPNRNRNMGPFYVKRFYQIFDFKNYIYKEPESLSKETGRFVGDFNASLGYITSSIRHKINAKKIGKYLMFDEYNVEFIRKKQRELKPFVFVKDNMKCVRCGCDSQDELVTHHVKPVYKGGRSTLNNLITLCYSCHMEVHKTKDEKYLVI